jgi:hypothetical protein
MVRVKASLPLLTFMTGDNHSTLTPLGTGMGNLPILDILITSKA